MGFDIGSIGQGIVENTVGAGLGLLLEKHNDARQINQQQKLTNMQLNANKEMAGYNYDRQLQMWKDTSYGAQREQMEKAGINPALMYGMGGGGGATTGSGGGGVSGGTAPAGGGEIMGMMMNREQLDILRAQKENIEADTANKLAGTPKIGAETENVKADTANKIADHLILEYTGKEAKDYYERVSAPGRGVQAKTYVDEMEARQGIAGTIYELWRDGKLAEKSLSEIEGIALQNAKTSAETDRIKSEKKRIESATKGINLDNMLKELELKLQERTGIDRNSPWYIKVLGRLFAGLTGSSTFE